MATRFYLPSTGAAAVSPAYGAWTFSSEADRRKMVTTRISSAMANSSISDAILGAGDTHLWRQYVSDPIPAQTITGTLKGQLRVSESDALLNHDRVTILVKVVSNDGSTLRGTLLALGFYGTTNEYSLETTRTNRKLADGDALSSVAAQANDRIVVEIGTQPSTTPLTPDELVYAVFGDDSGTDLPENETETAANNAWIEFSAGLFDQTSTPASVAMTATVNVGTTDVTAVPAAVGMILASSGGASNVLSVPASVAAVASVPEQVAGNVVDSFDPTVVTSQNFVVVRPTAPAALGDANLETADGGNSTFPAPGGGGTVAVIATAMADPVIPLVGAISYLIFRAAVLRFEEDVPNSSNYRMSWKVGATTAEGAITNDDGLAKVIQQADDLPESGDTIALDRFVRTGQIATQPNGSAWDAAAVNGLVDVAVKFDVAAGGGFFEMQVMEIFAEVYGPIGSNLPPIVVATPWGQPIRKTLTLVTST